ncbi:MAG: hypothetical protein A3B86_03515 [Candidatus Yanofskybacteria bacterium RIFCSPHIGHO2_02_FULL_38_22b]|uniref:Uncharacterized protein n=1 Tax=Candidatus Yanofskybacteria bacterium RIFCSPHIGHO2_02_FULL_38_22b TaxID=1802673 RepID=A0A1F8F1C3_9BACT|nr:MAG: hypothetical protein A3B86_03515 [Candidatus Yanofskybacteria bacterium RIFCSPHIGHO2_02_FULL_38_22b]OGN19453.1 MAG: hypothetical protein A2910_02895 [Candidatus Yanofskybacteria bacterium RIFCSPLOWO2_01_FULL_39_28]
MGLIVFYLPYVALIIIFLAFGRLGHVCLLRGVARTECSGRQPLWLSYPLYSVFNFLSSLFDKKDLKTQLLTGFFVILS